MGSGALPLILLLMSFIYSGLMQETTDGKDEKDSTSAAAGTTDDKDKEDSSKRPKPVVSVQPDENVFIEEKVTLICHIQETGDWQYNWYKDRNHNDILSQGQEYAIPSVDKSHGGVYHCKGTQSKSPEYSQESDGVTLKISERPKPVVSVQPDENVFIGEKVTLICHIQETGDWQYNWYKDRNHNDILSQGQEYAIPSVDKSHGGVYRCKVTQTKSPEYSQESDGVTLKISERPKPVVRVQPDENVFIGEKVTLICCIQETGDWQYSWYKGKNLNDILKRGQEYAIPSVDKSHGGVYRCKGTQSKSPEYSQKSDGVTLKISERPKPVVRVQPNENVFIGEKVTLICRIQETGDWQYSWYKGTNLNDILKRGQEYAIPSVDKSHGGVYRCKGTQSKSPQYSQKSDGVTLKISERPKPVVRVQLDENLFVGEKVTLICRIQETGDWQYSWYKGKNLNDILKRGQEYAIPSVDKSHGGVYRCKGTQSKSPEYSQESDGVTLTVSDKLQPTLTVNPQSSVFTGDTVTLSCDVGQSTGWTIHWRKDSNSEYTGAATKELVFVSISNGGTYQCRAQRENYYSNFSNTVTITVKERPKPVVHVHPDGHVFTTEMVTLTCDIQETGDWWYSWYKHGYYVYSAGQGQNYTITSVDWFDRGEYSCAGTQRKNPQYSEMSDRVTLTVSDLPTPTLTPTTPINPVFTGETVSMKCEIKSEHSNWRYEWTYRQYTDRTYSVLQTSERYTVNGDTLTIKPSKTSDGGQYRCRGHIDGRSVSSKFSSAVSLSVKDLPKSSLTVAPDSHVFTGETVNLTCVIEDYSNWIRRNYLSYDWRYLTSEWRYEWYKGNTNNSIMLHTSQYYTVNRDTLTIRGATGSDRGQYWCRGQRDKRPKSSQSSSAISLIMMDFSASVSLVVSPSRSQHFSSDSLSLSCEDQSNSAGWTVRRHTVRNTEDCSKQTGSTCRIISLNTSDTGVYWCQSESGEKSHPQNITVHDGDVILVSSVDPVIEGDTLTLHCLHRSTNSSILRADFYKDGSLVQNQTTGEMNIITVSKSHEGFYYCKTERGQSLHSWISVREKKENYTGSEQHGVSHSAQISVFNILTFLLAACPYLLSTVVLLLKCYRARDTSTEDQNQYAVTEEETSI
ncbi:hypothetical protein Q8A67_001695 [Cirrhinus molitorella]|uniref:Ig-like domain-containing protein n=1 Tax=Cirrhinus molitorella TaxID=172907 RepID=A0AA88Q6U6_9TELE|nr:hypothetical protein Q8A67_001695 [Cirrhinus molitorella]